jgi:hypothetical protein
MLGRAWAPHATSRGWAARGKDQIRLQRRQRPPQRRRGRTAGAPADLGINGYGGARATPRTAWTLVRPCSRAAAAGRPAPPPPAGLGRRTGGGDRGQGAERTAGAADGDEPRHRPGDEHQHRRRVGGRGRRGDGKRRRGGRDAGGLRGPCRRAGRGRAALAVRSRALRLTAVRREPGRPGAGEAHPPRGGTAPRLGDSGPHAAPRGPTAEKSQTPAGRRQRPPQRRHGPSGGGPRRLGIHGHGRRPPVPVRPARADAAGAPPPPHPLRPAKPGPRVR